MSTRSVIARKTGTGFTGVFHHWDGYPSGVGSKLFELYNKFFKCNLDNMLKALIDDAPAGWSTIIGDWRLPWGMNHDATQRCLDCGRLNNLHYRQHYRTDPKDLTLPPLPKDAANGILLLGHAPKVNNDLPHGPDAGLGDWSEDAYTELNAAGGGCEYAYVFDEKGQMAIMSAYYGGKKMIGRFGFGDPNSEWKVFAVVDLKGKEPDWEKLDKVGRGEEDE